MPRYEYLAKDKTGKIYKGTLEAPDEDTIRRKLGESDFYVTSITRKRELTLGRREGKVRSDDLVTFSQQFAGMIGAGLPILRCLKAMEKQVENITLRRVIGEVRLDIEGGTSLSEALGKHPQVFSDFFVSMIKAGETGGVIDKVLERLAIHLEKQQDLRRKVGSAFAYPVVVGTLAFLVMTFLVIVIVPIFKDVYKRINVILPGPTIALVNLSNFTRNYWWVILLFTGAVFVTYHQLKDRARIRKQIDHFKINMPLFGKLISKATISRFIRTFGDMLDSGVPMLEAIDVADKVAANKVVSEIVAKIRESVYRGGKVSEPLEDQKIFPPAVVQMTAAGEESGTLPDMLEKSANAIDRDVDATVKRLVVKVEPLLTMVLAAFVGFIALAIYLPIFDLIKQISER